MKTKIYFVIAIAVCVLSSCKKYNCVCTTSTWDYNSQSYTTSSESHTVKAMTRIKAESDCISYESGSSSCEIK